ncbi:MAG: type II secretion system F family protein [Deltaproteobacteria bacterium]|nr:type II secretion system F family protein [Deltaproteobacteria bacterium]
MTQYAYKATDPNGKIVQATVEAPDEAAAAALVQNMGYIPIRVKPAGGKATGLNVDVGQVFGAVFHRIDGKDLLLFTQDFATLLEAGIPVDRAMSILIGSTENLRFKKILNDILSIVQGGGYLSDALAKYPRIFSKFYVNMIRAGEAGGVLHSVMKRLGVFLESSQDLKDYIRSAMIYPTFLVFVGGISIIILMTYIIPRFSTIFSDLGSTIPLSTKILLGLSDLLRNYWWVILIVLCGIFEGVRRFRNTTAGRRKIDRLKLNIPIMKDFVQKLEVSRFARTLGTLLKSGVPILQAIDLVKDIISNTVISDALTTVYNRVKEGDRLSLPLENTGYFPSMAIQMITVGEETGRLEEMLLRIADNYEKTLKSLTKKLVGLLEPAMILFMGVVVAFIVISILMAVFSMNEIPI